jgi:hypothetical protein
MDLDSSIFTFIVFLVSVPFLLMPFALLFWIIRKLWSR